MIFGDFRLVAADALAGEVFALLSNDPAPYLVLEDVAGPRWYTLRVDRALCEHLRAQAGRRALAALRLTPGDGQKKPPWQDPEGAVVINAQARPGGEPVGRSSWGRGVDIGELAGVDRSPLKHGGDTVRGVHDGAARAGRDHPRRVPPDPSIGIGLESLHSPVGQPAGAPRPLREEARAKFKPDLSASESAVSPGAVVTFEVKLLRLDPGETGRKLIEATIPAEAEYIELEAVAQSAGFERLQEGADDWRASFRIYRKEVQVLAAVSAPAGAEGAPDRGTWTFRARARRDVEAYELEVLFRRGAQVLGDARILLRRVGAPEQELSAVSYCTPVVPGRPPLGEEPATLMVARDGGEYVIRLPYHDPIPFDGHSQARFNSYRQKLEQTSDMEGLKRLGRSLWNELPKAVQDWLIALPDGQPLALVNEPPLFLFELVWYRREAKGKELMLGAERPVLRSVRGYSQPDPAAAGACCVCPEYAAQAALPSTKEEVEALAALMSFKRLARTKRDLLEALSQDQVALVHIAGHGEGGSAASVTLQDAKVVPVDFQDGALLGESHPFIFLNVCRTGATSEEDLVGFGNFPKVLLQNGASGVVASMIKINSVAARDAAKGFYQALRAGATVGEAARRLRAEGLAASDPVRAVTLLSYLVFADPALHLTLPPPRV